MYILLFLLFALGSLGRISFFNQEINIYLFEVVYFGYLGWLFYKHRLKPYYQYHNIWLDVFVGFLGLSFIVHLTQFSAYQNIVGFMYLARLALYLFGIPYLLYETSKSKDSNITKGLLLYVILNAVLSVLVYILYPNLRNLSYLGWDPHAYRMMGTNFDVSFAAALYGLILLMFLYGPRLVKNNKVHFGLIGVYCVIGLLTFARAFYISIILTILLQIILKQKKLMYAVYLFAAVMLVLIAIPKPFGEGGNLFRTSTIGSRIENYAEGFIIWRRNPFFGVGYNRLRYVAPAQQSITTSQSANHAGASLHSSFLTILATSGMIGLALFLMYIYTLARISFTSQLYLFFLSIYALFDNTLLHPSVLFLLSMLIVMGSVGKKVIFRISR